MFDRWWLMARLRMRALLRPSAVDREVDEELRDHVERRMEAELAREPCPMGRDARRSGPWTVCSSRKNGVATCAV